MENTKELIRSLRKMAVVLFQSGEFEKQKTIESAADRLEAFERERLQCYT